MKRKVNKLERIGVVVTNITGSQMKCIEYYNSSNISVEFENGCVVHNIQWNNFIRGKVKNPFGYLHNAPVAKNGKTLKEYYTWYHMLERCCNSKYKEEKPTYNGAICCDEWLSYDNFYEWLHRQENFETWYTLRWSAIDKDIVYKGNKLYSPENCFLVPSNVNTLFVKCDLVRGELPIGVSYKRDKYEAHCMNPFTNKLSFIGSYDTKEKAFEAYKDYKENLIKQVANIEHNNGTITEKCRNAMYAYKVDIND